MNPLGKKIAASKFFLLALMLAILADYAELRSMGSTSRAVMVTAKAAGKSAENRAQARIERERFHQSATELWRLGMVSAIAGLISLVFSVKQKETKMEGIPIVLLVLWLMLQFFLV